MKLDKMYFQLIAMLATGALLRSVVRIDNLDSFIQVDKSHTESHILAFIQSFSFKLLHPEVIKDPTSDPKWGGLGVLSLSVVQDELY
jgi:hypothetical protein